MNKKEILLNKLVDKVVKFDCSPILNNYLKDYMQNYDIYYHVPTVEKFISDYSGKVCYDFSGEVKLFIDNEDVIKYINNFIPSGMFDDHILDNLYTGQKEASYCSGYGWHYISLKNELERLYDETKNKIYTEFILENKLEIINEYEIILKENEDFEDVIYDYLDGTELSDYIVFESYEPFIYYLNSVEEADIVNMITE
jgi:hypothetical protein